MRKAYQAELDRFTDELADLTACAEPAIAQATTALVEGDVSLAEAVITGEPAIRERHHRLDNEAFGLLARQQPVATDLRILVAGLRMSVDLERMGVLARHVAEIVVKRHPHHVVPPSMNGTLAAMGKSRNGSPGKPVRSSSPAMPSRRWSWRPRTTRWTSSRSPCTASCSSPSAASTLRPRWTSSCWAATTSASPTTPFPSASASPSSSTAPRPSRPPIDDGKFVKATLRNSMFLNVAFTNLRFRWRRPSTEDDQE